MSWPDDQAYNEAIQNPRICFSDAELRSGTVGALPTGLPRVMSGNFASVYQIKCPQRTWAVRCFRREITDQQARYAAIGDHLRKVSLPYVVAFEFLREGIRVGGRWLPILKMEWLGGQCLDQYVKQHLDRPDVLLRLSRDWLAMTQSLQRAQVAHGDLQNGNVLVVGGALKLIDYDGMYVPALAGRPSSERGHPDFQHPARSDSDFSLQLDAFSAWVVFSSLLAVSVAPYLWDMLNAGGDKLLFGREDFAEPGRSPALAALRQSGSEHLVRLAEELEMSLRGSPRQVRPLDALYVPRERPRQAAGLPEWVREHVDTHTRPIVSSVEPISGEQHGAEWLIDHLVQSALPASASFGRWLIFERMCAFLALLSSGVCAFGTAIGAISPSYAGAAAASIFTLVLSVLIARYRRIDVVRQRGQAVNSLRSARHRERAAQAAVDQHARTCATEDEERRKRSSAPQTRLNDIQREHAAATLAAQRDTNAGIASLTEQRRKLADREATELRAAEARGNAALGPLMSEFNGLQSAEQLERARALQAIQAAHVTAWLSRVSIAGTYFPQIGSSVKESLRISGISTAADVSRLRTYKVYGVGDKRKRVLLDWRAEIEKRARQSMPTSLPPLDEQRIRSTFSQRAQSLQAQIADQRRQLESSKRAIQDQHRAHLSRLDAEIASARARGDQQIAQLRARLQSEAERYQAELRKLNDKHAAERAASAGERARLERVVFQERFAVAQAERESRRFQSITFPNYIGRIIGVRRAG